MSGILGQAISVTDTWVDLYTCPALTIAVMRVIITNRGGSDATFRVAASENGDAIADLHHISHDKTIVANDTGSTIGFVVSSTDVVRVYASNNDLRFTATGETSAE